MQSARRQAVGVLDPVVDTALLRALVRVRFVARDGVSRDSCTVLRSTPAVC